MPTLVLAVGHTHTHTHTHTHIVHPIHTLSPDGHRCSSDQPISTRCCFIAVSLWAWLHLPHSAGEKDKKNNKNKLFFTVCTHTHKHKHRYIQTLMCSQRIMCILRFGIIFFILSHHMCLYIQIFIPDSSVFLCLWWFICCLSRSLRFNLFSFKGSLRNVIAQKRILSPLNTHRSLLCDRWLIYFDHKPSLAKQPPIHLSL